MHLRNQATQRSFSKRQLGALLVVLASLLGFRSAFLPGAEYTRTSLVGSYRVPIAELSGLTAVRLPNESTRFAAVGDENSEVVFFELTEDHKKISITAAHDFSSELWAKYSLCGNSNSPSCQKLRKNVTSDWEAIHATDDGMIHILQEYSSAIVSFRIDSSTEIQLSNLNFESRSTISSTEQLLRLAANKDPDLGEGLVILDEDTILATKENNPAAIIRFIRQPSSDKQRDYYQQQRTWQWTDKGCDISDVKVDPNGQIFLLSQTCRKVALIEPLDEHSKFAKSKQVWYLPSGVKNPEALVLLSNQYFLIGSDRKTEKKPNIFLVKAE